MSAESRKIARDAAWGCFRNGEWRLALALLIWPTGWSHTRLARAANSHEETG